MQRKALNSNITNFPNFIYSLVLHQKLFIMTTEKERMLDKNWKTWGPYLSNRQWGTVREDYSHNGNAWGYTTYSDAIGRTYRWSEDGIAGICDNKQKICFAFSFWNRKDKMIKERFFGLSNHEGNHGEDIKEIFFRQYAYAFLHENGV